MSSVFCKIKKSVLLLAASVFCMACEDRLEGASVAFGNQELSLKVGDVLEMQVEVSPESLIDQVIWSSSDESVLTVNKGMLTAVSEGTATITAAIGNSSAECAVVVRNCAESVTMEVHECTIYVGDEYKLEASVFPEGLTGSLDWTSDDPAIASVGADGMVTGNAEGQTYVKVSLDGISDSCAVTVLKPISKEEIVGDWTAYSDQWDLSQDGICYEIDMSKGGIAVDENGNQISMSLMDFCEQYVSDYNSDPSNTDEITLDDVATRVYDQTDEYRDYADFAITEDHITMYWGILKMASVKKIDGSYMMLNGGKLRIKDKSNSVNDRVIDMKVFYNDDGDMCFQYRERYVHLHYNYDKSKQYFIEASTIFSCVPGRSKKY